MENLKVKELIEVCEELGLTLGGEKRKQAILEIMKKEGVTAEEVDEAWADIKGCREEAERRELCEREREEAERQERLKMKRIELALRQCSQAPSVASATVPHCGFVRETASTAGTYAAGDSTSSMEENASSVDEDFERLNRTTTFAEFVEADDDVAICGELSLDDAIAEALPDADTTATSDEDEDDAAAAADAVPTSFADMLRHIDGIRSYVCTREATEDVLLDVAKLDGKLLWLGSRKVQKKLTDFF
ncbi:hypothetical protein HPB50_008197 [Hyalomma asiaticum]|uniref:Uncharacterized protein n=1 Tax=Hyalomma asiaticum TaxID=266040 RepID=A0ACB7SFW6_HYAAI|nr:hypothetical protein HPB50_008197 [Hyalomma asiaticum]